MSDLDNQANQILQNLSTHFQHDSDTIAQWTSDISIGVEVEVKWSAYFPQLWEKYLKHSTFKSLSPEQQKSLSEECSELEKTLLPKLKATEKCGLEKGLDKYYEFALPPVNNIYLIQAIIQTLRKENLIPSGEHSIHFTVGNLPVCKDTYYLLLLLETQACSAQRIASAFHLENAALSATWARKGMGGLFEKQARELKNNATCASEFRTLFLNDETDLVQLLKDLSLCAQAIMDKRNGLDTVYVRAWNVWLEEAKKVLHRYALADENWKKPNLTPQYWKAYMQRLEAVREDLAPMNKILHETYYSKPKIKV